MYNTDRELVDCITLKVEPTIRKDDFNKRNNTFNSGYEYTVRMEDANKAMIFITELFKECKLPCERIYPVNFKCAYNDSICSKDDMIDRIVREALRLGTITKENISKIKK